ncbi:MAG: hypothetical protein J6I85_06205 [Clostridia bacterium]|nr:hypothetical protein [Clostridia bacterium]
MYADENWWEYRHLRDMHQADFDFDNLSLKKIKVISTNADMYDLMLAAGAFKEEEDAEEC